MAQISIEIAYAEADQQWLLPIDVPEQCSVAQAIEHSEIRSLCPHLVVDDDHVGIFGKRCRLDDRLSHGDRVEIYRPLQIDPREVRRQRAAARKKN